MLVPTPGLVSVNMPPRRELFHLLLQLQVVPKERDEAPSVLPASPQAESPSWGSVSSDSDGLLCMTQLLSSPLLAWKHISQAGPRAMRPQPPQCSAQAGAPNGLVGCGQKGAPSFQPHSPGTQPHSRWDEGQWERQSCSLWEECPPAGSSSPVTLAVACGVQMPRTPRFS